MSAPAQGVNPEVRAKFVQMREDIKKVSNTLQDVEAQQSEYRYDNIRSKSQLPTTGQCKCTTLPSLTNTCSLCPPGSYFALLPILCDSFPLQVR